MSFDSPTESPPEEATVQPPAESERDIESTPDEIDTAAIESGQPPADEVISTRQGMFGVTGTGDTSGYGRLVRTVSLPGGSAPRTAATSTIW